MTVGELKKELEDYPDDFRVSIPDPTDEEPSFYQANHVREAPEKTRWVIIE